MFTFLHLLFALSSLTGTTPTTTVLPFTSVSSNTTYTRIEVVASTSPKALPYSTSEEKKSSSITTSIPQKVKIPPTSQAATSPVVSKPISLPPVAKREVSVTSQNCNSNYSGCLKSGAGDYDCVGGSGDGPNYTGVVQVLGVDEFGLDRDHDGWACE